ncbi:MAG: DUF4230 domain-containing protein [Anaerolineae bacterium]
MLRKIMYIFLIIFFITASIAAYTLITAANKADDAIVQPIGDLVRELILPVTPVILPDAATILQEINDEARLITVSAEYEKIVRAERAQDVLWGLLGEKMIFVAYGKVVAGVDLSQMTEGDIQVLDPTTVQVHLPDAEIFDDLPVLDNEKSYVYDRDKGIFASVDPALETQVRQKGEEAILAAANDSDLLTRANFNAQQEMLKIFQALGFENVIFMAETPPPAPTYEQDVPKGFAVTPESPGG